ncbi:PspC domain-containing protein [Brassicibacter mesophilus]|uniref:PspC domain-containing protein n=1 Tax=Brassicibacter mesophilus TaxID=745119 RepID=UPI003D1CA71B
MKKQLYRSTHNKIISGVCGGIAEYFEIDPIIIRLLWALITFTKGIGFIAYIICMIIIPENTSAYSEYVDTESNYSDDNSKIILGVVLVILGLVLVAKKFIHWLDFGSLLPIFMVLVGIYLILKEKGGFFNEKK